ncbi:MAG: TolC family outer membrane protein [Methylobacter sp.]|nr:TolC family outer membrane protein [Methylobacter sp.]MDP2428939.1 TolC family outer membrane protein [Methylobacter sp.]MDP3056133.1 TolC family outer membrane protein [Methylobacter sp.]MDP3363470.1 TolC family outer membrane protein [Methylobacter sp.]MDZ4220095.1 TolC family outer membrane protein [Methylobacter sp.]
MNIYKHGLMLTLLACIQTVQAEDLFTVYQQALQADPQLQSANVKIDIGAAQKGQALGQMLPQINASGNWSANKQTIEARGADGVSNFHGTRYQVSLNQSLIDFAKFWEWRRAAKVEDQYAAEAIEAHNQLMFNVVERYFNELEAEDQLNFAKTEKLATQKQLEQVQKQYAKQMLKITDLYAVEARLDQIIAAEILAESKRVTAQQSLRELTGVDPAELSKLRDVVNYQEIEGDLQQWIEMAQSQNPAISAKQIAIQAAENNVTVQQSKYLPVVDFQMNYFDTNTGFQSTNLGTNIQTEVAAINVNIPIFSGGTTTHQMFEAKSRLQLSRNDNEAAIRAITKETSDAFLSANANARHIKAAQKALDSAGKSREAMERGFSYGVVTISDLIKAQQDEFSAKKDFSQAKYNYIKNRIRFMHAIGSIAEENLQEINGWLEEKKL